MLEGPGLFSWFFGFDQTTPPFGDIHVRRAFAHAFDSHGFVRSVLRGHGQAATSVVPPGQWGNLAPAAEVKKIYASLPKYPFSIAKAKARSPPALCEPAPNAQSRHRRYAWRRP